MPNSTHRPEVSRNAETADGLRAEAETAKEAARSEAADSEQSGEPRQTKDGQHAETAAKSDFVRTLVSDWGFSEAEAGDAYDILESVGCGYIAYYDAAQMRVVLWNEPL